MIAVFIVYYSYYYYYCYYYYYKPGNDFIAFKGLKTRKERKTFKLVEGNGVSDKMAKKTTIKSNQFQ